MTNAEGESLIQASVFLENTYHASITDENGFYRVENIKAGEYTLKVSYVGYKTYTKSINLTSDQNIDINLGQNILQLESIEINTSRVDDDAAYAVSTVTNEEIEVENLGQDVPFVLRWTPSTVVTSDAGTGIGYTGIRIRGSDATSINVSINGIPLNDAESQGVFWVDLPDFLSSVDNIQIQRGVGTSTSGPAAFGGSISLNTNKVHQNPYAQINTSIGSFNSRKLSVNLGTGLINGKYSVDGRYSIIKSDGYIDRASADLSSWYFSASRLTEKSALRFLAFAGKERTYQAWWGTPESKLSNNPTDLQDHIDRNFYTPEEIDNLLNSDRRYNYYTYDNQVDDYQQEHYQLHYSLEAAKNLILKASAFYTRGLGYFEEYKNDQEYSFYGLPQIDESGMVLDSMGDLVRRRWLDNDFYGAFLSSNWKVNTNLNIQFGASATTYKGDHYGNVISAEGIENINTIRRYYEGVGDKSEQNGFIKFNYDKEKMSFFADFQIRNIEYSITGEDDDLTPLNLDLNYRFFNPKMGMTYHFNPKADAYISFAVGNKEPIRSDLIANLDNLPTAESLYDFEAGYRFNSEGFKFEWNNYYMQYDNQLVLTGDVDQSGAFIKTNVGKSYRLGAEISFAQMITRKFIWDFNTTLSRNKVESFVEDLGEGYITEFENTDISFSPNIILSNGFTYEIIDDLDINLSSKYVSKQYLDNTQNEDRILPAYFFSNLRVTYDWNPEFFGSAKLIATVYNLFDEKYSSNGYTYSYAYNGVVTENFLYPQAGIHFMLGINIDL